MVRRPACAPTRRVAASKAAGTGTLPLRFGLVATEPNRQGPGVSARRPCLCAGDPIAGRGGESSLRPFDGLPAPTHPRAADGLSGPHRQEIVGQSLADGSKINQALPKRRDSALLTLAGRPLRLGDSTDADSEQAEVLRPASIMLALAIDVGSGRDGHD